MQPKPNPDSDDPTGASSLEASAFRIDPDASKPEALTCALEADELVGLTLMHRRQDLLDQSPRGYDLALAALLVHRGCTDQEVVDSLTVMRRQHGKPIPTASHYYSAVLQRSRFLDADAARGPGEPPPDLESAVKAHGAVPVLADLLEDEFHFAADGSRDTFVFTDGRYVRAADLLHEAARSLLENGDARKSWTISLPRELNAYLGARAPRLWSHPGDRYLNLTNGLLDLTSGTLLEHDPRHLSTVQLPVEFQPEARCPGWDEFVATTFPEDAQHVAYELVALTMVPNSACQRAVLLLGGGGNGKSRYLTGLQAFLGSQNVSRVSLHRLESDRFASSRLDGMLANVWADLPAKDLVGSTMLKSITGGDVISSERKYHDSYNLATFCRLIFSANSPPRTPDADAAFFSRWTVIPFGRSFRGLEGEVPSDVLDARLADPAELSGLLNRALECLPAVRARGLSEPPSLIAARNAFRAATDPVAVWIDEHTVTDPEGVVAKRALLDAFNRDARAAGDPVLTANAFGRAMRRSRPTVSMSQRRLDGRPVEVWTGISLASDASAP